jgi:hypothetical protein
MARYKKIVVLNNAMEADLISNLLKERGIPHCIRSFHDSAYDGLYQAQKGWGRVEAPEEYKEEIEALFNALPGEIDPADVPKVGPDDTCE